MKVCSPVPPSMVPCCRRVGLDVGKSLVCTSNHCTTDRESVASEPVSVAHKDPPRQTAFIIRGQTASSAFEVPCCGAVLTHVPWPDVLRTEAVIVGLAGTPVKATTRSEVEVQPWMR